MSAQPKYITQPEFDAALGAFSGHVDHAINMAKADFRREIVESENRLRTDIQASEGRLQTQIQGLQTQIDEIKVELKDMHQQIDRVENVGKQNHQMMQIMLEEFSKITAQLSKITKKLGTD